MKNRLAVALGLVGLLTAGGLAAGGSNDHSHAHEPMQGGGHKDHHDHANHHGHMAHWTAPAEAAERENPVPATPESIAQGQALYGKHCASCHGAQGRGDGPAGAALNPPPANLAVMASQHPAGDLAWKVENGRGAMPAWKQVLSESQIWDLVNYIKSL
jgi:mono/diheme cytochrome c family protein